MEKISIAVAFKGGEVTILKVGTPDEALAAYREAELDVANDFVGMLRKPVWYKRNTPARNKVRESERQMKTEVAEVEESRAESLAAAKIALKEAELAYEIEKEAERLQAERDENQLALNLKVAAMEAKERAQGEALEDEKMFAAQESITKVAPSAESEKSAKKKKK